MPRTIVLLALMICLLSPAFTRAETAKFDIGKSLAEELGVDAMEDDDASAGGYWKVKNDFDLYFSPRLPRGEVHHEDGRLVIGLGLGDAIKISDIEAIRYAVRTGNTPHNVNVMLALFTDPGSDPNLKEDDEPWYQRRAASEPLYCRNYKQQFPTDKWGLADTASRNSPMLFFDLKHSPPGFANGPTLAMLQNAGYAQTWRDFSPDANSGVGTDTIAYGRMTLKYVSLSTYKSEGNWKDFKGDLDHFSIELKNGQIVTADFGVTDGTTVPEPPAAPAKSEPAKQETPVAAPAKIAPTAPAPAPKAVEKSKPSPAEPELDEEAAAKKKRLFIGIGMVVVAIVFGAIVMMVEKNRKQREADMIERVRRKHADAPEPRRPVKSTKSAKPTSRVPTPPPKPVKKKKRSPRDEEDDE